MARIALAMVAVCAACMGDRVIAIEDEPAPAHLTVSEPRHSFGGVTLGYGIGVASSTASVTAVPAPGWLFAGWSGDCAGASPSCQVAMTERRNLTASFVRGATLSFEAVSFAHGGGSIFLPGTTSSCAV